MPKYKKITYRLARGGQLTVEEWPTIQETQLQLGIAGVHAASCLVRRGENAATAKIDLTGIDEATPENVVMLGEGLIAMSFYLLRRPGALDGAVITEEKQID
jgi:hypothetical protein